MQSANHWRGMIELVGILVALGAASFLAGNLVERIKQRRKAKQLQAEKGSRILQGSVVIGPGCRKSRRRNTL